MTVASNKTANKPAAKLPPNKAAKSSAAKKPRAQTPQPVPAAAPVEPIPGLMSEADMESHVGALSAADKSRFTRIRNLLAHRFGSREAARVWLTTPGRGFDGTPLDAIRDGNADLVLDTLKSQSSQSPPYA